MGEEAEVSGYTAWLNVHLAAGDCQTADVLKDLLQGLRLRALLQSMTGSAPKRLDSLDGLSANQKVMRIDWFVDALKASKKLPHSLKVDSKMISLYSSDHLFPVLWHLLGGDVSYLYERVPLFLSKHLESALAEPLQFGPCKIARETNQAKTFYTTSRGKSLAEHLRRRRPHGMSAQECVFSVVNRLLKTTTDGRRLKVQMESDLVDSKVLCALTNALVPETFPTEVLVNDRWTINLALTTFSKIVRVQSLIDSEDLYEGTKESSTAFLAYVLLSGLQFCQAVAVVRRMEELERKQEELERKQEGLREGLQMELGDQRGGQSGGQERLQLKLDQLHDEVTWIQENYDHDRCKEWMEHARAIQAQVKVEVNSMMQRRFDVVTVPRSMTINRLTESLVINLCLTGGVGFYLTDTKETLWTGRRLVAQDKSTGEFYEDFSGYDNHKGTVREMLGLHPCEIVEVNTSQHPDHMLFFESTSRNKILKAHTQFMYQVFPGTTSQCRRQLLRAARAGELDTVRKLIAFFKDDKAFVSGKDSETGNTALHMASRHGHMEVTEVLLDSGAGVNAQNNAGCTPFFLATEGLHKTLAQLLLEWGADIHIKNRISKTALELTRNADMKEFLARKYIEYQELSVAVLKGDHSALESHIDKHITSRDPMASLASRCIKGSTLLHLAASTGCLNAVKKLLSQHVRADVQNAWKATPLHVARDPLIVQLLLEHGGSVSSVDASGNTSLHSLCMEDRNRPALPDCISLLVEHGASLNIENNVGQLPIHCAASHGLTAVIEYLLSCGGEANPPLEQSPESGPSSLPYLALTRDHLHCAQWLTQHGSHFQSGELDEVLLKLLQGQPDGCSQLKESVKFVLEQGTDANTMYKKENRPLHLAARLTEHPNIVDELLDKGAELNATNSTGATPLIAACQANNVFSASRLLSKGAAVDVRDSTGKCAFEYIRDYEEWIQSGNFSPDIISVMRSFKLRQGKHLVSSITHILNSHMSC